MSILSSLIVVCAVVPFLDAAIRRWPQPTEAPAAPSPVPPPPALWVRLARAARRPAVAAAVVLALAAPIDTALLSGNRQVILIEQGQVGKANAQ